MTRSLAALWSFDKRSYVNGARDPADLSLPNFLGIGAQKAGTNWLWENLRCHPELFLPEEKELHYFNLRFYVSLASYGSRFSEGADKIKGEVTPAYSILPKRKIEYISQVMPDVRLILILRNPIDRAWSRAKMVLRKPGAKELDIGSLSKHELDRAISHPSSIARGSYTKCIDNWMTYFPENQLHICFFDDIAENPRPLLEGVFQFLGVEHDVEWARFPYRKVITPGAKTLIPDEYRQRLLELYKFELDALQNRFGAKVAHWR